MNNFPLQLLYSDEERSTALGDMLGLCDDSANLHGDILRTARELQRLLDDEEPVRAHGFAVDADELADVIASLREAAGQVKRARDLISGAFDKCRGPR